MLFVDKNGLVDAERIIVKRFSTIERGKLDKINGIVVHQTDSTTSGSVFNSYQNSGANGAHFLIDKDGTIYQTASLYKVANHVVFLQSRCLLKKSCSPQELKKSMDMDKIKNIREKSKTVHRYEASKDFPNRFPYNADSIGVEIVGKAERIKNEDVYEPVNDRQNESLKWLIKELSETLSISLNEIYRHPDVGRKNATEASTAKW
ncbi:N-acetylmuramoyl-L-alanine amidase [Erwinia tracheiphila]|uniref:N-acetylmuramoyl-L-alanine amidase n=1 Tax=Erwinia tracheiphila TaxID=65700 RepID=A0A345CUA8_9GAMM|nr:peptidoglycan recognition family protein [Erwinia tracheiphila]AXF77025.1 N-acetylmuramoyl-L-alanine amidase [Erwinia tracheiphila]UIA84289.1 N-acetylmuramoyl-L-alanine amidase [Erwinia tracheiphila]UIA92870.1 N-acetylmuramoyl-L-alanine amidase [Erwinia tracheiphila]